MPAHHLTQTFDAIKQTAMRDLETSRQGKVRVAVQVAHCSRAVGADDIAEVLSESITEDFYMVTAGCDGACFNAPRVIVTHPEGQQYVFGSVSVDDVRKLASDITRGQVDTASPFFNPQRRVTMDGCGEIDAIDVNDYIRHDGYAGLAQAIARSPEEVIEEVKQSGLRGRGGAYFPAALKWESARSYNNAPRYLVVNCEEGEPGIFKDRHLMEGVSHRIIEGAMIAAYASGINQAYIYINAEANLSAERMSQALDEAYSRGLLGKDILGSGFDLEIEIRRGAGGYVCGEETTLLNTMEGYRREPRLRPPFPTEAGLWAKPTVINNAETLASLPFILNNGASSFNEIGTESDKGTKIVSLSGSVQRPGVAEVPMGTTLRQIIYDIGGGPHDVHSLTAIAVGGPSSGVLPVSMLDTPIKPGFIHDSGVMLGAGGVIAIDERISILEVLRNLAAYNANESCGKCTPCREGTPRMVEMLDRLADGQCNASDFDEMRSMAQTINAASLCGLGQAAGNPILSALHFFGDELALMAIDSD